MRPITLYNWIAFFYIAGSFAGIGIKLIRADGLSSRSAYQSAQRSAQRSIQEFDLRSSAIRQPGDPTDELEAKIQLYMQPDQWALESSSITYAP